MRVKTKMKSRQKNKVRATAESRMRRMRRVRRVRRERKVRKVRKVRRMRICNLDTPIYAGVEKTAVRWKWAR